MVKEGSFREDLYFRLNVVNVMIEPLRERREEIPVLIESFMRRYSVRYRKQRVALSDQLMRAIETYAFPGNVRELENMIKRVVVLESEASILDEIGVRSRSVQKTGNQLHFLLAQVIQLLLDPRAFGLHLERGLVIAACSVDVTLFGQHLCAQDVCA